MCTRLNGRVYIVWYSMRVGAQELEPGSASRGVIIKPDLQLPPVDGDADDCNPGLGLGLGKRFTASTA